MLLEAKEVVKRYKHLDVLKGVSLSIDRGELVALVGSSGAGKSTLLQVLGTLLVPEGGEVILRGKSLVGASSRVLARVRNQEIGFVFQSHRLLLEFNLLENVCLPGYIAGRPAAKVRAEARELLAQLEISDRATHLPDALSGGEAQRAAVARAFINRPALVLADEPSGNLDSGSATKLHDLFVRLCQRREQAFLIATHNESLASVAGRCLRIQDGLLH